MFLMLWDDSFKVSIISKTEELSLKLKPYKEKIVPAMLKLRKQGFKLFKQLKR